jgi:hypothetical protein
LLRICSWNILKLYIHTLKFRAAAPVLSGTIRKNCDSFRHLTSYFNTGYWLLWRVVSYKASQALLQFLIYSASPSELNIHDSSATALWLYHRHLAVKQGVGEKVLEFSLPGISTILRKVILHSVKSYAWCLRLYFSSDGRCAAVLYRPYKSMASDGFEPVPLGSSGKHTKNTTNDHNSCVSKY